MAKKENRIIDENFMKEIISQGLPMKSKKEPSIDKTESFTVIVQEQTKKNNPATDNHSKSNQTDYESRFLQKMELPDRRSVYVSNSTHEKLTRLVALLGNGRATVSSYVEAILQNHFKTYKAEISELYTQSLKDLL